MIFFQLLVYSCVTANGIDGSLLSKTCDWRRQEFYLKEEACKADGNGLIGHPIFSDTYEDRKIENFKCTPMWAK